MKIRIFLPIAVVAIILSGLGSTRPAYAAVSDWQKGVNILSANPNDFGSASFDQSLQKLKADGANYVGLVVTYSQANIYSTQVVPGPLTPTDSSLLSAIRYAKSLGLGVTVIMHDDPDDGNWRANINPSDRQAWFSSYDADVVHTAQIAQQGGADIMVIGAEMVDMATDNLNSTNTSNWESLIGQVRGVFQGKLTYGANSTDNTTSDEYSDEKKYIKFWPELDYVGLSAYYSLGNSEAEPYMESAWQWWNVNDSNGGIQSFAAQVGKPILFTEIGYRSLAGAEVNPWDSGAQGSPDQAVQANAYQALFNYWNNYGYMGGVYLWDWSSDPNSPSNDTSYSPENKQAEGVMKQWFGASTNNGGTGGTGTTTSGPHQPEKYNASATLNTNPVEVGQPASLTVSVANASGAAQDSLVDIEVYNSSNQKVYQTFQQNQSFAVGQTLSYNVSFAPPSNDKYHLDVGVFTNDWSYLYDWSDSILSFSIGSNSGSGTGGTGTTTSSGPSLSSAAFDIWWPTSGSHIGGTQPFKGLLEGVAPSQYQMYWQVDGGAKTAMTDNSASYPHKEADVDVDSWTWKGQGPYDVNFIVTDASGNVEQQKSVEVYVN